jgi:intergrase/recombinase
MELGMGVESIYSSSAGCPLNFAATQQGFIEYVRFKKYNLRTAKGMVSYLARFVREIRDARDIMRIFSELSDGQRHNLNRAIRAWFTYMQIVGVTSKSHLDSLRAAIPQDRTGIDLNIPEEAKVASDLKLLICTPLSFQAVYNLLLDSGLRLVEAMQLVNNYTEPESINGFYRNSIGMFRGGKQAYYGYYSAYTYNLIRSLKGQFSQIAVEKYAQNHDYTRAKYLRKFAFDKMIELEIPESVADFIEGRVPKRIGARHYMILRRQADNFYGRYAAYLAKLRGESFG